MLSWQNFSASALDGDMAECWDTLNAARGNLPFLSAYVMVAALREFGDGRERLLVARDAGGPAAMLIVRRRHYFKWETFQPSQIPLGAWVARKDIPLLEIARSCQRNLPGPCLILGITQIDPLLALRDADVKVSLSADYIDTAWVEIESDFVTYWNSRGRNLKQNLRRQRAKLKADGISVSLRYLNNVEDMADAVARYGALESAGWKGQQGTAIHRDNAQGRFYTTILEEACRRDEGVVFEYSFGDKPVAMNLCLQRGSTLIRLKTTYDETTKPYSPAMLLQQDQLELSFHEGRIKRMEFYGKIMEWHTRWTDRHRTIYHLTVFRWGWLKKVRLLLRTYHHFFKLRRE